MVQFIARVGGSGPSAGASVLAAYKELPSEEVVKRDWCSVAILQDSGVACAEFGTDANAQRWIAWMGTWFHAEAPTRSSRELLELAATRTAARLAQELEGFFTLIVGDERTRQVTVITDRCGSCHVYTASVGSAVWISTSSAALAALSSAAFDVVGVHEFLATGTVFGARTLWRGVSKIAPACVYTTTGVSHDQMRYWTFEQLTPERFDIDEASERICAALRDTASRIGSAFKRVACDVTGGYDSRACLMAFLSAGVQVDATVSGDEASADVRISREIARAFGLRHIYTGPAAPPTIEHLRASTRLTDGEYDAFDYARIRRTHLGLSKDHDISVNGSFGELARGYWWELLFPHIGRRAPIDARRITLARFTAGACETNTLTASVRLDLCAELEAMVADAVEKLSGFPNTTQLDAVYYLLRMQRWQGRIASSTHQLWPCLSPFAFPAVLIPVLETKARARMGSRLVRTMIDNEQPQLAAINLEYGYPAQPLKTSNLLCFAPCLMRFARRAVAKTCRVAARRLQRTLPIRPRQPGVAMRQPLDSDTREQLHRWATEPMLLETGLFDERRTQELLTNATAEFMRSASSSRLVTLELLLREMAKLPPLRKEVPRERPSATVLPA